MLTGVGVQLLVDVDQNTRVVGIVSTWYLNSGRIHSPTTTDNDLVARHIESGWSSQYKLAFLLWDCLLGTTNATGNVQSDDFSTKKIISRCDTSGDLESVMTAIIIKDL